MERECGEVLVGCDLGLYLIRGPPCPKSGDAGWVFISFIRGLPHPESGDLTRSGSVLG